jgi:membrane protein CcdC involved in cytochrome C biogenesis
MPESAPWELLQFLSRMLSVGTLGAVILGGIGISVLPAAIFFVLAFALAVVWRVGVSIGDEMEEVATRWVQLEGQF